MIRQRERYDPDRESEPFYNRSRHLTKSFGVDLALGKHSLDWRGRIKF
jgi:hypothetical protein